MNSATSSRDATAAAAPAHADPGPWVVSPGFDALWLLAGLWMMMAYALTFLAGIDDWVAVGVGYVGVFLALVHAWSTTWTVLGSPVFAEARVARPMALYVVPGALTVGSVVTGVLVVTGPTFAEGAGFGWEHSAFALYLTSFVLIHFFHFAQQDFGVLSLYRHRAKQFSPIDRRVDLYLARFLVMVAMPLINLKVFAESPFKVWVTSWLPVPVPVLSTMADAALVLSMVFTAGVLIFELRKPNSSFPKAIYLIIMGLHPLTLWLANITAFSLVYVFSHWIIAIALAWRINRNHNASAADPRGAWTYYAIGFGSCVAISAFVHFVLEDFGLFDNVEFRDYVGKASVFSGMILGLVLAEQLTHYYYDRVLFKFSDPYVRENVGPLLH